MKTEKSSHNQSSNNSQKLISCIINPAARDGQSIKIWETVKIKLEENGLNTELYITCLLYTSTLPTTPYV